MTSARLSRNHTHSATSTSSRTTESPTLSHNNNNESDTVLVAKKLSNVSLGEREERQQALDRLEMLKTVRIIILYFQLIFYIIKNMENKLLVFLRNIRVLYYFSNVLTLSK
jgi:hypothetical protein